MLLVAVVAALIFRVNKDNKVNKDFITTDTLRVFVYDTIRYNEPAVKEEKPLKKVTAKLPVINSGYSEDSTDSVDSTDVVIPITQTVYEDSTYTAYVSGYRACLDSMIVRMPREVTTVTKTHYQKPKRWSIGIQVGYGMTLNGTPQIAPYVGIGVSYNLFSF